MKFIDLKHVPCLPTVMCRMLMCHFAQQVRCFQPFPFVFGSSPREISLMTYTVVLMSSTNTSVAMDFAYMRCHFPISLECKAIPNVFLFCQFFTQLKQPYL